MARYGMSTGWKIFWWILVILCVGVLAFCLATFIIAGQNDISFGEQFLRIFGVVKNATDTGGAETVVATVNNLSI